jgi:dipeptidase
MRKYFLTSIIMLSFVIISLNITNACTNYLVTKGASTDGSVFISYSADSHVLYGELYYKPAGFYADNTMVDVYEWDTHKFLGKIKQAKRTYSVIGNMNEFQVAIGETTFGGREELADPKGAIDYGSLMYIGLQRSKTAREAIHMMANLANEYGYCSEGESFSISDANEVWIMEMIGKGPGGKGAVWVAQRVPDGYVCAHANQSRIRKFPLNDTMNCLYSKDVISFARQKGYFKGEDKDFSFVDAYAPLNFGGMRFCEARVWSFFNKIASGMDKYLDYAMGHNPNNPMPLWIKPDKKLSTQDIIKCMRDHFEGTPMDMTKDIGAGPFKCPYRWRPLTWKVDSVEYCNERAVSTQQTGFVFVAQSRSWLPSPIGGIFWFGMDDTYSDVFIPVYCGVKKAPDSWAEGNGSFQEFTWNSAWWVFNFVANYAYSRYSDMIQDIQVVQTELEGQFMAQVPDVDKMAMELYKTSPEQAKDYLTKYSCEQGEMTVARWRKLGEFLIWKYLDGNVKDEFGKPHHLGYSPEWYKRIANETGDKLKVIKTKEEGSH